MFGLFKSKTEIEKLQIKYNKLMKDYYRLSSINRSQSDAAYAEANKVMDNIEKLKNENS
ncbi:Lacal_2735 family protein [Olleya sp. R77988]|uniref:Lacal_2735 family protein n=1 Tax=Olleya sp. R77988 TaxID=3093875 RepID=UPI0037C56CA6